MEETNLKSPGGQIQVIENNKLRVATIYYGEEIIDIFTFDELRDFMDYVEKVQYTQEEYEMDRRSREA